MGEILTFVGRHEEAEGWIRKSMQLNPYHSQRYWTHLGRSLIHLGRFEEALNAFENVPRPRLDDLVYRVVAASRGGNALPLQRNLSALRKAIPRFEPSAFAASLPYQREEDRQTVLDALVSAGVND
jgi:adenylate cyclase